MHFTMSWFWFWFIWTSWVISVQCFRSGFVWLLFAFTDGLFWLGLLLSRACSSSSSLLSSPPCLTVKLCRSDHACTHACVFTECLLKCWGNYTLRFSFIVSLVIVFYLSCLVRSHLALNEWQKLSMSLGSSFGPSVNLDWQTADLCCRYTSREERERGKR